LSVDTKKFEEIKMELRNHPLSELMVVTKNRDIQDIKKLFDLGQRVFGENRVQEADKKFINQNFLNQISLHLIGPLQTNKTKRALEIFDTIQSVDRVKIIDMIAKNLSPLSKTKNFYLQVNIGNEPQKAGINSDRIQELYNYAQEKNLNIKGLMCIPPANHNPEKYFQQLCELKNVINPNLLLSMGMSGDYHLALKNKSNLIRVGSLIFDD
tara:strand:+ start:132 stop:764 length:633 start_codon:yes stop_codon:yes gene_type:complete